MSEVKLITNEDEAIDLLKSIHSSGVIDGFSGVKFDGWPSLEIKIVGIDYNASLKTSQLKAIIKMQETIYYQYGLLREKDHRNLNKEERELLELKIGVGKGSTDVLVELTKILNTLLSNGLPSLDIITGVVLVSLIYGSKQIAGRHFDLKEKEIEANQKHLEIIDEMAKQSSLLNKLLISSNRSIENIAKSAPDSDDVYINGISTSNIRLNHNPKKRGNAKAKSTFVQGVNYSIECNIVGIKDEGNGKYECSFKDVESGEVLIWKEKRSNIHKSLDHELRMAFNSKKAISIQLQIEQKKRTGTEVSVSKIFGKKPRSFKSGRHNNGN